MRALLVDFDGVVRHWDGEGSRIETAHGLPIGSIAGTAFARENLAPAITGRMTDEEWRALIAERLGKAYGTQRAQAAVAKWSALRGTVHRGVASLLESCGSSVTVVLVSNATTRFERDLSDLGLDTLFAHVVNSSRVGYAKPSAEIFAAALAAAGVTAEDALFVDDTVENVDAGQALGIDSHHFRGLEPLRQFLRSKGVVTQNAL